MKLDIKEILAAAKSAGLTDGEICNIARVHRSNLYRWRSGKSRPQPAKLGRLVKALSR